MLVSCLFGRVAGFVISRLSKPLIVQAEEPRPDLENPLIAASSGAPPEVFHIPAQLTWRHERDSRVQPLPHHLSSPPSFIWAETYGSQDRAEHD